MKSLRFCGIALLAAVFLAPVSGFSQTNYGIWISKAELANIPMSGVAWDMLKQYADANPGVPDLSVQTQTNNVYVLAKAIVYARTGIEKYRTEVIDQCMRAIDTEVGGSGLALGRELAAYVIAADLVGLPADKNSTFRTWLRRTLTEPMEFDGRSLQKIHELRANNWGTMAGASRAAVAAYLNDSAELANTARIFKGWLGDRTSWAGWYSNPETEEQSWLCNPPQVVGINPRGCTRDGHDIDGVLGLDQGRGGPFTWPPFGEYYAWEGLKGAIVQAEILYRAGYDVYNWQDKALWRAYRWLFEVNQFDPHWSDYFQIHIVNFRYNSTFPEVTWARYGNIMAWTDFTHGPGRTLSLRATDPVTPPPDTTVPTAPSNLAATVAGSTQINLSWTASTDNVGVTGYRLERCQGTSCTSFAQIASPTATTYSNSGLTAGTSYSYRVRATDAAGNLSGYSNTAGAITTVPLPPPDTTAPTAPSNLTATPAGETQINLSWSSSTDNVAVTGYRLERCQGAGCTSFVQIASPAATTYSNAGLTADTSYSYRVRATDAAGNAGTYSNIATAKTAAAATAPPPSGGGGGETGGGGSVYTTIRVEQKKSAVKYSGTWYNNKYSKHSGGSATKSPTAGSKATFKFTGIAVSWIGYRDHTSGIANVYLDGIKVAEIDSYSPAPSPQAVMYSKAGLSDRSHTLVIEATGRKRAEAVGRWVWVDAFDYTTVSPMADAESSATVQTAAIVAIGDAGLFQVGQAPIRKSDDTPAPAGGFAILRLGNQCSAKSEAGIAAAPLTDSGRIYIEQSSTVSTGIAFANPNDEPNTIGYLVSDLNGRVVRTGSFELPAQGQLARFGSEAPFLVPPVWDGTLTFTSTLPVAVAAVRSLTNQLGENLVTITNVADLSPLRQDPVVIPHFVDGAGWTNQIVLINPADSAISGTVQFAGTDIPSVPFNIAAGAALKVQTPTQTDSIRVGAIRIVPAGDSPAPAATSVISYKVSGITVSEVSLAGVDAGQSFTLFAEKGTKLFAGKPASAQTGLAVVNSGEATVLQLELISGGNVVRTAQMDLPAYAHRSLYLAQIPGFESVPDGFTGVLRVSSTGSEVVVAGVRTAWDECNNVVFSSVPAVNDDLIHPNSRYVFPHFAFGSGFSTRFVIFENAGGMPGSLEFYSPSGTVLTPPQ